MRINISLERIHYTCSLDYCYQITYVYSGFTYLPTLDFALVVNPPKEEPCLPMLVRAADLVGAEPTNVSTLVVVPEVKPRS
jgi:hypothetical protein